MLLQEQPAYTPQVEAISPTLPNDSVQDEAFRLTKDDLLNQIHKIDREISKVESEAKTLRRKEIELIHAAKLMGRHHIKKETEEVSTPKHQSPAQKIYAENRRLAQEAHNALAKLGPEIDYVSKLWCLLRS